MNALTMLPLPMPKHANPADACQRLHLAIIKNLAEDLGCTGKEGGMAEEPREPPETAGRRRAEAEEFVRGAGFDGICQMAEVDADNWRADLLRKRKPAPAAATNGEE